MAVKWIEWGGGAMPVSGNETVQVEYRDSPDDAKGIRIEWPMAASRFNWSHDGEDDDIVRYRIVTP